MACGSKTIKYLLFLFNLIFALGGLAILVLGAIIQWNIGFYDQFFGENIAIPSIILIVVGSIVFIISFFGCFGAIKESRWMLILFATCMGLLFVAQVVGAVLAFVFISSVQDPLRVAMQESLKLYIETGAEGELAQVTWDTMQRDWKCCGVDGYTDWESMTSLTSPPTSCQCKSDDLPCEGVWYAEGCYDDMKLFIETIEYAMAGIAISVAAIELFGIVFSCYLARSIKKNKTNLPFN